MKKKKKVSPLRVLVVVAAVLCILVPLGLTAYRQVLADISGQTQASIAQNVRRCAVQCYAIEGAYPPDVAYMEQNYGLVYNKNAYIVAYDAFAANEMPDITVLKK